MGLPAVFHVGILFLVIILEIFCPTTSSLKTREFLVATGSSFEGDTSFVSFEKLGTWVRALIDEEKLDIPGQGKMNDGLTLEAIDDLLNHAERNAMGEIEVRTVPGYLDRLAPLQRQKVILACREILGSSEVSRAQLEDCFYKNFLCPLFFEGFARRNSQRVFFFDIQMKDC